MPLDTDIEVDIEPLQNPHAHSYEQVIQGLQTNSTHGMDAAEAGRRLAQYGPNQLAEAPPTSFWKMLAEQFNNFVVMLLIVASIISALLGDWVEASAIMAIVILNAALGVIQEQRAEQALAQLRKLAAPDAQVFRNGSRQMIPAREVVPGDIVVLESGHYVPADVRLIEAVNLHVEEAALTGESHAVEKNAALVLQADVPLGDRKNTAFMGTMVSYGRGRGVVVSTGMRTQLGMIAEMLQNVEIEQTPLQQRLDELGRTLGWAALAVSGLVFLIGWLRGYNPLDIFLIAVSLAIAAVPEGLPAVVTITLALGMREMIKRHALIRRLASVETLGSATIICSDKTGTLTQNQMTATQLWVAGENLTISGSGYSMQGGFNFNGKDVNPFDYPAALTALWVGALNSDAELENLEMSEKQQTFRVIGDPTEGALVVAAAKAGGVRENLEKSYPRVQEIPFDSARKRMITIHHVADPQPDDISPFEDREQHDWYVVAVKGAPDVVLDLCTEYQQMDDSTVPMTEEFKQQIFAANEAMTQGALRVLAVAYRVVQDIPVVYELETMEQQLTFVGLVGMIDPARPAVRPALETARRAGIRTVMITGDYPNTARAIAADIGLLQAGHQVLTGAVLNAMDDAALQKAVQVTDVFARVSPEHKLRIVKAFQAGGEVVAMTGDGVNDAPAVKQANIGVAMGITGTDVVKETADMVLTDDNYASIVAAVEQGRSIYSNIRKFVFYLLSCNLAEIAVIFLATLAGLPSPLTAIQLLWLNLITDGAPALALGMEKGDPDLMDQPPRPPSEPIINKLMKMGISIQTVAITVVTLTAYGVGLRLHPHAPELAETMAFVTLSFSELLRAFTARSERYPLIKIGLFSNKYMNWAVVSSLGLLLAVVYVPFLQPIFNTTPLTFAQWEVVLPLLLVPAVVAEVTKWRISQPATS